MNNLTYSEKKNYLVKKFGILVRLSQGFNTSDFISGELRQTGKIVIVK